MSRYPKLPSLGERACENAECPIVFRVNRSAPKQRFCSLACSYAMRPPAERPKIFCPQCRRDVVVTDRRSKYCGHACAIDAQRAARRAPSAGGGVMKHANATSHTGPYCESPDCPVCELFCREDESHEQMVARLTARYSYLGGESHRDMVRSALGIS